MTLHWPTLKEECPMAIQVIQKETGFNYEIAYGTLLNADKQQLNSLHLKRFFDDQGWFLTEYPLEWPKWNGRISDRNSKVILDDPGAFQECVTRNHAISKLIGIAVYYFEEQIKEMYKASELFIMDKEVAIQESRHEVMLESINFEDLTLDAQGLASTSNTFVVKDGNRGKVLKNTNEFPFVGMIITI